MTVSGEKFIQYCMQEDIEENRVCWTSAEEEMVFRLQQEQGNKWSAIALRMPGHTENSVKNKFYSTLRKGLRKINKYIGNIRRKTHKKDLSNNKLLKPDFLTKLTAIADRNFEQKYQVKPPAIQSSQQIQQKLIILARNDQSYDQLSDSSFPFEQSLLSLILQFKKHCKKRKGKRKVQGHSNLSSVEVKHSNEVSYQERASIFQEEAISKVIQDNILKVNAGKKEQNLNGSQMLHLGHLRKGFGSLHQQQELRQPEKTQNIIKKSITLQESIPNFFNPQYSITTSSYFSNNYSLFHLIDPSPLINSFTTFNNPFFSNLNRVQSSFPFSQSSDPRYIQNRQNPMFFINQIPYIQPKPDQINLWDGIDLSRREEVTQKDPEKSSKKKLYSSEAYNKASQMNSEPFLMKSDSFKQLRAFPHLKNQSTCYSSKKIQEYPEPSQNNEE